MAHLQGNQVQVRTAEGWFACQLDATVNYTANTTADDPCKPDPNEGSDGAPTFNTYTVDSKDWSVTLSAKAFADELAMNNIELNDIAFNGDGTLDIIVSSVQNNTYNHPLLLEWAGNVIITDLTNNFPATGAATYDVTLQGNGDATFTKTPVTT